MIKAQSIIDVVVMAVGGAYIGGTLLGLKEPRLFETAQLGYDPRVLTDTWFEGTFLGRLLGLG